MKNKISIFSLDVERSQDTFNEEEEESLRADEDAAQLSRYQELLSKRASRKGVNED